MLRPCPQCTGCGCQPEGEKGGNVARTHVLGCVVKSHGSSPWKEAGTHGSGAALRR